MTATVQDVMSTDLVTCDSHTTIADAAKLMRERGIGDVLVTDQDGHLAGIVTDRDLVVRCLADGASPDVAIEGACSTDVVTLSPDGSLDVAVRIMREQSLRRLPVVQGGRPVGIVTLGDLAIEQDPDSALGEISADAPNN